MTKRTPERVGPQQGVPPRSPMDASERHALQAAGPLVTASWTASPRSEGSGGGFRRKRAALCVLSPCAAADQ
jgi:hypothetical protein